MYGTDLRNRLRDGSVPHVGRHGRLDWAATAGGRLRRREVRGHAGLDRLARGDVGGIVGVAADSLREGTARSTRQGRGLGAVVPTGSAHGVGGGMRGLRGCDRSGGRSGGDELGGDSLVRGFLMDRLERFVFLVGNDDGRGNVPGFVNRCLDDRHFVGGTAAEEEGTQLHGGLLRQHTADDLGRVGHASIAQDVAEGSRRASLRIPGAEDDAVDARCEYCARAHRAGLEGDDEGAARQAPGAPRAAGLTQGDDFGVACGVMVGLSAVSPASDDAATFVNDDGSDGNVSRLAGTVGQEEGLAHCFAVLLMNCHPSSLPTKRQLG